MPRLLSNIKQLIVTPGKKNRIIKTGPFKGIKMELDLTNQTQLYLGLHERELYRWLDKFSPNIKTAIDIGAAQGEYALYFLQKTSAEKIYAFEPSESGIKQFNDNVKLNEINNTKKLILSQNFVTAQNNDNECTLDSLFDDFLLPCLIKIDVDGGETDILQGAKKLLASSNVHWIIETHSEQLEEECLKILKEANYKTKIIDNAWWRIFVPELRISEMGSFNRWLVATKTYDI